MPSLAAPAEARAANPVRASALILPVFVAALFLSAFLVFSVQPMFAKMVLPVLGGTPAVWSVAMVFFQALLLAGYLHAHLLTRWDVRIAGLVHIAVMAAAFLLLPIGVAEGWGKPPSSGQAFWLLGLFTASVGLPFFAVAGNGPLFQAWFARSNHAEARDPYFLYAASNIGSFAALLAYPLGIEPFLALKDQSHGWTIGFLGLAVLVAGCAVLAARYRGERADAAPQPTHEASAATARDRLVWVGLSFVPSGLLVAVTAHISTDVAAAPLLWIMPLALFLLTFVVAFRDQPFLAGAGARRLQVWGTALVLLSFAFVLSLPVALTLHLGMFFLNALICHAALYRRRPPAHRLTEFYLCMSLGGVLGGIFCGLVAPYVFSTVIEYPILLVAALLGHPSVSVAGRRMWVKEGGRAVLACAAGLLAVSVLTATVMPGRLPVLILIVAFAGAMASAWRVPQQVVPLAIGALVAGAILNADGAGEHFRSFFGVHKVRRSDDGQFLMLAHGTTLHGAMRLKNEDGTIPSGRPEPVSYYIPDGAIASGIALVREAQGGTLPSVAAVGLGTGSLACHIVPGEAWTFFEIDPEVLRIAGDPRYFRFLRDCAGAVPVVLGDARLKLAEERGGHGLIVIDAFSSDAIPSHLLTREAMGLYREKLSGNGAILFHISNRHLDLTHVVARTAAEHGLVTFIRKDTFTGSKGPARAPSIVAVVARDPGHVGRMTTDGGWQRMEPDLRRRPWTDDFSNILQAVIDKKLR